jgi:diadenosine tetraphosphate (Ap4A) HIT family hydrolase
VSGDCVLCRHELETPVLRESAHWRIAINRNQNLLGKTMVILRRHEESVARLSPDEWRELGGEIEWLTGRLREAFAPDHFNYAFLQNQDRHVHLHVIPRYATARGIAGVGFDDPDYPGHYRVPGPERRVDAAVIAEIAWVLGVSAPEAAGRPAMMSEPHHDLREDDPQLVDPDLADTDPDEADTGGLAGGGGPAATIKGDEIGEEDEGLADTDHRI